MLKNDVSRERAFADEGVSYAPIRSARARSLSIWVIWSKCC